MIRRLIDERGSIDPDTDRRGSRPDPYEALARAIVGQQLSTKAAGSIWERLVGGFGGTFPSPRQLIAAEPESLREAGLSRAKVGFLRDLAERIEDGRLDLARLPELADEDIVAELTEIKGIGRWTAEMFLIFNLLRPDVFPLDDLGLQKGIRLAYFKGRKVSLRTMRKLGELWRPWRSVATWYLWRSLDPVPVEY